MRSAPAPAATAEVHRGDYSAGLRDAYLGELAGAAFAETFAAGNRSAAERESCTLIARIEAMTARALAPLLDTPPTRDELDRARRDGEAIAARLDGWAGLIDYAAHGLDGYVDRFRQLRDAAPAHDRPALDLLVDHEVALRDFGTASLAGNDDPDRPLLAAIAAVERHLIVRP